MNSIVLSGRLTKDVEVKESQGGGAYTRNTIAVDNWDSKNKKTKTIFVDFVAFSHNANYLGKYARKGSEVTILGTLDSNKRETDDGKMVTYWSVIANVVEAHKSEPVKSGEEEKAEDEYRFDEKTPEGELPFEM